MKQFICNYQISNREKDAKSVNYLNFPHIRASEAMPFIQSYCYGYFKLFSFFKKKSEKNNCDFTAKARSFTKRFLSKD